MIHKTQHSFWIQPIEPLKSRLRSIIGLLASRHEAVDFEPHVTVSCGVSDDVECIAIAEDIAKQFQPLDLAFLKLDHSSLYTKTLFAQFEESATLKSMTDFIKKRCVKPSGYILNPHLSLLYKTMAAETQAEICRTLDVPQGIYSFDRLRVIETETPLTEPAQIKRWRTVFETSLG